MSKKFFNKLTNQKLISAWKKKSWKKEEKFLFNLQKNIYRLALRGQLEEMTYYQKIIFCSISTKSLAVNKVIQEYNLKISSIIQLKLVLSLRIYSYKQLNLYSYWKNLNINLSYKDFGFIYKQIIVKLIFFILKPQWEAYTEINNFNFQDNIYDRDAVLNLSRIIRYRPFKYFLNGKIKKNDYNYNNHKNFIYKLNNSNIIKNIINFYLNINIARNNSELTDNILTYGIVWSLDTNPFLSKLNNGPAYYINYGKSFCILCNNKDSALLLIKIIRRTFLVLGFSCDINMYGNYDKGFKFIFLKYLISIKKPYLHITSSQEARSQLLHQLRALLYKKDFLGRNRALTHITLQNAILKINVILIHWFNYFKICTLADDFLLMDKIIDNSIYRWQIKKYKRNITITWKRQCLIYINNRKRIGSKRNVVKLLFLEYINRNKYFPLVFYRSIYDLDKVYWK